MTGSVAPRGPVRRARRATRDALLRRLSRRDDSGQVIVIVLVLVVLLAALAPVMAGQVTSDATLLTASANKHAALAAAEAGIQWYRDNLDSYPSYYTYTASNNPTNDAALSGWCGAGQSSTCDLSGTSPPEAFHYVPDDSQLFSQSGGAAGTVVLTVTGRAGNPGSYSYVYARATFSTSSILDNAYFSNYEVLDPNSDTVKGIDATTSSGGTNLSTPEVNLQVTYSSGSSTVSGSLWNDLCQYDTYSPNAFIDALGLTINGQAYSASYPYYGPYMDGSSIGFYLNSSGVVASSGTKVTVPAYACGDPYDFVSGETFDGPVYTNDQLHVCGSPTFNGAPVSLTSGASANVPYLPKGRDVPGSVAAPSGSSLNGYYVPQGFTTDNVNCAATGASPSLAHGVALNGNESLPSLNTSLAEYGTTSPPAGTTGTGCTYVGPTMIELVTSGSTTTMDVWSPLSTDASITSSACANGSSFSATHPLVTGVPLPSDGVVSVLDYTLKQNSQHQVVAPAVPSDGSSPCFNPYQASSSATSSTCYEGDVYVEGELDGQLTIVSSANIVVTRDLTYACADAGGSASQANPSSLAACTSESTPDILGLSAKYDVLVSGNNSGKSSQSAQSCAANGFGDGTASTPANTPTSTQLGRAPYTTDSALAGDPAAVWPTLCNPQNLVVDAAVFALNGSFGVENWGTTPQSGNVYLNGSDLSFYRGPFGYVGASGYYKEFSFDKRLQYATPPHVLQQGVDVWQVGNYIVCPTSSCPAVG